MPTKKGGGEKWRATRKKILQRLAGGLAFLLMSSMGWAQIWALEIPVITEIEDTYQDSVLKYTLHYPQISVRNNPNHLKDLNIHLKEFCDRHLTHAQVLSRQFPQQHLTGSVDYTVTCNRGTLFSICYHAVLETEGNPPTVIVKGYTGTTDTGTLLRLEDLFQPGIDYQRLLTSTAEDLASQREDLSLPDQWKGVNHDTCYYLTDEEIVLVLDSEFPIPLSALSNTLSDIFSKNPS